MLPRWGTRMPLLAIKVPTGAHAQPWEAPPTPKQSQNEVSRAAQGSAGGRERGSCTGKEIIETGLFMLVGKGAWIWIKPCAHFANYPAAMLKEKKSPLQIFKPIRSLQARPTYTSTNHHCHHRHFLSSHNNSWPCPSEYGPCGPIRVKSKSEKESCLVSRQRAQGRKSHSMTTVGRSLFPISPSQSKQPPNLTGMGDSRQRLRYRQRTPHSEESIFTRSRNYRTKDKNNS